MEICEYQGCKNNSSIISRLSNKGSLLRTRKKTNSFIDAYEKYNYCKKCHDILLNKIWKNIIID